MLCFLCRSEHGTPNNLIKHLKVIHGLCPGRTLHLKCGQAGCPRSFGSFSGFRKHLNKCHVSSSFDSVGEGDCSLHQSILDTNVTNADFFLSDQVEAESTISAADIVNNCSAVISDLIKVSRCRPECSKFRCDFHGGDCSRYPSACKGNCG